MNYTNEDLANNNQIQINPNGNTAKYIKSINYPQNNKNITKITFKNQKIKSENMNPEIIDFQLKGDILMPRPKQNLEPYQNKEQPQKNQIFENIEMNNKNFLMPKHSIKSSNSFKINTKINNKKYLNKINKINDLDNFDNDNLLYKNYSNNNISNKNFNILGQYYGKIQSKKISNYNLKNINNTGDLKIAKSSIQINGNYPLPESQNFSSNMNNNRFLAKINPIEFNIEGGNSPKKKFQKKYSYNSSYNNIENIYDAPIYKIPLNNGNKTNLQKKENNINYNYKSDHLKKELKKNKININNNNDFMDIDKYTENNFIQGNNEYNNIFFYDSQRKNNNINEINENIYQHRKTNNMINVNSEKEKTKNKFIYKKTKSINKKEETLKSKQITFAKKEIKNNLKNNFDIIDFIFKLPQNEEKISININEDNIKEKIENIIDTNKLNNNFIEPLLSVVNDSINILNNVNKLKFYRINRLNIIKSDEEELKDNLNYSYILDLMEKNKYEDFIEKIYSDIDDIKRQKQILNMSI